jgi:Lrp/AsnC family leucine-responsive transcriptional regulator
VKSDEIDLRMLQVLQDNARVPVLDLAERVGLSSTSCTRRLQRLQDEAIIKQYVAVLNPKILNSDVGAFLSLPVRHTPEIAAKFRAAIRRMPNVWGCWAVSGEYDYLLWANAKDLPSLSRWVIDDLHNIPSVRHTYTTIIMESIKDEPSFFSPDLTALKGSSMLRQVDPLVKLDEIDLMLQALQDNARDFNPGPG